jgi:hypothetical protein
MRKLMIAVALISLTAAPAFAGKTATVGTGQTIKSQAATFTSASMLATYQPVSFRRVGKR